VKESRVKYHLGAIAVVLLTQAALAQNAVIPAEPLITLAQWFHPDDYPPASMRGAEEGDVSALLLIDTEGLVTGCRITHSSGHLLLDRATCALAARRGRFNPAKDAQRRPVVGSYAISDVKWRINGIGAPTGGPPIVAVRPPLPAPASSSGNGG
jgi:TonB family protein